MTFSCPSFYAGKKLFAFLYEDGLVVKTLPEIVKEKIHTDPSVYGHFSPGEGIMKNWLMITRPESSDYEQDKPEIEAWLQLLI